MLSAEPPLSWHTVLSSSSSSNNYLRRYIALEIAFPLPQGIIRRSTINIKDQIKVIIGGDSCASNVLICNGPLVADTTYR